MTLRIAHLTSAHPRHDVRIYHKMCCGLAHRGFDTYLVVADGRADAHTGGVKIVDAGMSQSRYTRMIAAPLRVLRKAMEVDADVYHLHDPELLPIGLLLKSCGRTVVFDSHEDVQLQMHSKHYIPRRARWLIARLYDALERYICKRLSGVVAATPSILSNFARLNPNTALVRNYPRSDEFGVPTSGTKDRTRVCYVGGISAARGIREVVAALALTKAGTTLDLAGRFSPASLLLQVSQLEGWGRVNYVGEVDRFGVGELYARATAGIVCFLPHPNHVDAYPNKLFEYMAAGLPVIASDFPAWRTIVQETRCGLLVDPADPVAIAAAIDCLKGNPDLARTMGENGRRAISEGLNWQHEEDALAKFYARVVASIVGDRRSALNAP